MSTVKIIRQYKLPATLMATFPPQAQKALLVAVLAGVTLLSACSNSGKSSDPSGPVSGNWQFQLITDGNIANIPSPNCPPPQPSSPTPVCMGGFLVQSGSSITGQLQYSMRAPSQSAQPCNGGSAPVTGTASGQNVTLTAVAGPETFSFQGTLSSDGTTIMGTYTSDGKGCGYPQSGSKATWTATLIPSMTGSVQGTFHSTAGGPRSNQDFSVSGFLVQGPNTGASSGSVTGTLNFQGYPCVTTASVNGQISGSSAIFQIIGSNGLTIGQIGSPPQLTSSAPAPATFTSSANGRVLEGSNGYLVSTGACPASSNLADVGNLCLAVGNTNACTQPVTLSPAFISFPPQFVGSPATSQSFTLTNTSSAVQNVQLSFPGTGTTAIGDFNGLPQFSEQDTCASSLGTSFSLAPQQSCTITVSFSPQESCSWDPSGVDPTRSAKPSQCPPFLPASVPSPPELTAFLSVKCLTCSTSLDGDTTFTTPASGIGLSAIQPSTPELDFGAEQAASTSGTGGEVSPPQSVVFTNQSASPVQILSALDPVCSGGTLPRPAVPGSVSGIQIVMNNIDVLIGNSPQTVAVTCDVDATTKAPSFPILSDTCSGTLLQPQQSCTVTFAYAPQPGESNGELDYFLELNTLECTSSATTNCEIDSGRFPVELKSNIQSPLRMSPGAGLDFGTQTRNQTSGPMSITLTNDAQATNPETVTFTSSRSLNVKGDFAETDNCGVSLAPGSSCTMNITFTPTTTGYEQGTVTITYKTPLFPSLTQTIYMRGTGQ